MKWLLRQLKALLDKTDMLLLLLCLLATGYGAVLIASSTQIYETSRYVLIQLCAAGVGVFLYLLFSVIDLDILTDQWKLLLVFSVALIGSLFFFGETGGTVNRAWLRFGPIGIQPSEVVKVPYVIILSRVIAWSRNKRGLNHVISVGLSTGFFLFMFLLIILSSDDLGSALVYLFIFLTVMYVSGLRWYWFMAAAGAVVAFTPYAWSHILTQRHRDLILAPYDPTIDPTGYGITWQVNNSKAAIASGGVSGTGLFSGTYTSGGLIPKQHTDFVFSVAGEELGFIGAIALIAIVMAIILRCIITGLRSGDRQATVVCFGFAGMLIFQTFENIGMCLGLTPVIGITLPFFSYGGSSVVTAFAAMGIVSGIRKRPAPSRFVRIE